MRLPSARAAVGIYGVVLALAMVPQLTNIPFSGPQWVRTAFVVPALLLPVALFVAAFCINHRWAFAIPVVAEVARAVLINLFSTHSLYVGKGTGILTLRHDLWDAVKSPIPIGLLVVAVALVLALTWAPRTGEQRIEIPEPTAPAIAFAGLLALMAVLDICISRVGFFHDYVPQLLVSVTAAALAISVFLVCLTAYSPWLLPLPIFLTFEPVIAIITQPGFSCDDSVCKDFLWPALRNMFFVWAAIVLLSVAAGWWVRREEDDAPDQTSSFDPSITARSPGSEK